MSFEWQTEEDGEWEAEGQPVEVVAPHAVPRRRWPAAVILILLAGVAGLFLYRQAQERVAATQARVSEEVLDSHVLLLDAAASGDEELFVNTLSGRDERWAETQQMLVAQDLLFNRPGFGLRLLPARKDPEIEVNLAPALNQAEVGFRQTYAVTTTGGATETVQLMHHAVYRKGARQWLYAPLEDPADFWGSTRSFTGERLTVTYPARDAEIGQRLATELDEKLVALCRKPRSLCTDGWHLFLNLGEQIDLLRQLAPAGQTEALRGRVEFSLPAPTLVGVPVDESGYNAVFQGYADYVLTSAIANLAGYDCCQHVLFFRAFVEQQLVELGVRPALLPANAYLALIDDFQLPAVEALWERTSLARVTAEEQRLVRAFVAFLATEETRPTAAWQRSLVRSGRSGTFRQWLARDLVGEEMAQAWQTFLLGRVQEAQGTVVYPLPEEDLLLACNRNDSDGVVLVRDEAERDQWVKEQGLAGERAALLALPGRRQTLVYRYGVRQGVPRSLVWHRSGLLYLDSEQSRGTSALLPIFYTPASPSLDPRGQYLVLLRWNREERVQSGYRLFDLSCEECDDVPFPGVPVWSPDGAQVLAGNERRVWRLERNALDRRAAAIEGQLPFWLDRSTYGYLSGDALMLATIEDDRARPFLRLDQLVPLLSEAGGTWPIEVLQVLVPPDQTRSLLLIARQPDVGNTLVFRVERTESGASFLEEPASSEEITLLWQQEQEDSALAYLIDGGRLLAISTVDRAGSRLRVYDVERERKVFESVLGENMGAVDFASRDGWLALTAGRFVELVALPEDGGIPERHLLFPPFTNCTSATWLQEDAVDS